MSSNIDRQLEFNDYFHLVNFWRKMTANGMSPVIGKMAFDVNDQYVEIKATDKWIKRDELLAKEWR